MLIGGGGKRLSQNGRVLRDEPEREYAGIYRRFLDLIGRGESDLDAAPLALVADAFLIGRRRTVEAFET